LKDLMRTIKIDRNQAGRNPPDALRDLRPSQPGQAH
jgi:hypothetical protein